MARRWRSKGGAWGAPGALNLVYKQQKTPTAYNGGRLIAVRTGGRGVLRALSSSIGTLARWHEGARGDIAGFGGCTGDVLAEL
jgi:hypothetical protein